MNNSRIYSQKSNKPGPSIGAKISLGCLAGCGLLLIILITLGMTAFRSGNKSVVEADLVARQFMTAVYENRTNDAYALGSDEMKQKTSLSMFTDTITAWRNLSGTPGAPALVGQDWYTGTDGKRLTLLYNVPGSKHLMSVKIVLISHGGPYRVWSCFYTPLS